MDEFEELVAEVVPSRQARIDGAVIRWNAACNDLAVAVSQLADRLKEARRFMATEQDIAADDRGVG